MFGAVLGAGREEPTLTSHLLVRSIMTNATIRSLFSQPIHTRFMHAQLPFALAERGRRLATPNNLHDHRPRCKSQFAALNVVCRRRHRNFSPHRAQHRATSVTAFCHRRFAAPHAHHPTAPRHHGRSQHPPKTSMTINVHGCNKVVLCPVAAGCSSSRAALSTRHAHVVASTHCHDARLQHLCRLALATMIAGSSMHAPTHRQPPSSFSS